MNANNPVMRFAPGLDFTFSDGWNFRIANRGRVNNVGFISDQDYEAAVRTPLLAVVGDSYVEALMVPFGQSLQGRLARCIAGQGRVYSFGISGAQLSQYLIEADFARANFHPDAFVVVIVGNDFDESLRKYRGTPGFHYFLEADTGLTLQRVDFEPSLIRQTLRRSALARYARHNLGLGRLAATVKELWMEPSTKPGRHVGNTGARFTPTRAEDSRAAVDAFLTGIPRSAGALPGSILLLVDGMRPELYSAQGLRAAGGSYFDVMRRYLIAAAEQRGFEVVDLQPQFVRHYMTDSVRFETPPDGHWNVRGYEEAANAVAASKVFQALFPSHRC